MKVPEPAPAGNMTRVLREWRDGDEEALGRLTTQIYGELRRLASAAMSSQSGNPTIQPTALVHEFYFKLPDVRHFDWQSRAHFLNVAAKMMRNILVDHARRRQAEKRGGDLMITQTDASAQDSAFNIDVLLVHEALDKLVGDYPRQARVVELRFFGGLSVEETCEVLKVSGLESSVRTVERDWTFARAWLEAAIGGR